MFGHSDNQQVNNPGMPGQQNPYTTGSNDQTAQTSEASGYATAPQQPLGEIPATSEPFGQPMSPFAVPAAPAPEPAQQPNFGVTPSAPVTTTSQPDTNDSDLLDLKQKALQQLSPLVSQLEQNPEEKFKTTMMMIQASDDQALLPAAYEAAQAIPDEKAKAQALLDVVNEINYFTQSH